MHHGPAVGQQHSGIGLECGWMFQVLPFLGDGNGGHSQASDQCDSKHSWCVHSSPLAMVSSEGREGCGSSQHVAATDGMGNSFTNNSPQNVSLCDRRSQLRNCKNFVYCARH